MPPPVVPDESSVVVLPHLRYEPALPLLRGYHVLPASAAQILPAIVSQILHVVLAPQAT